MMELHNEAAFATFRDTLLYAAALGAHVQRRRSFSAVGGDPIRYETLTNPSFAEALVGMISANEFPEDPEIMDNLRLEERVLMFEEYANGGLDYLQEQVNIRHQPAELVVLALVTEALSETGGPEAASVDELLSRISW